MHAAVLQLYSNLGPLLCCSEAPVSVEVVFCCVTHHLVGRCVLDVPLAS